MPNSEARARARMARYLLAHASRLGLTPAVFARALGVSRERIRTLTTVTPQLAILYRMGTCLEHVARTGEVPPPPPKKRSVRRRARAPQVTTDELYDLPEILGNNEESCA